MGGVFPVVLSVLGKNWNLPKNCFLREWLHVPQFSQYDEILCANLKDTEVLGRFAVS